MDVPDALQKRFLSAPLHYWDQERGAKLRGGVYGLYKDGGLLYIGQSNRIGARLEAHSLQIGGAPFDAWRTITIQDPIRRLRTENDLIKVFSPIWNRTRSNITSKVPPRPSNPLPPIKRKQARIRVVPPERVNELEGLATKDDVARYCKVSRRTVDRWIRARLIPYLRFGNKCVRFQLEDVRRAITRMQINAV
jgi:excisionase family DNA binding protein